MAWKKFNNPQGGEDVWNMAKNFLDRLDKRCDERDVCANTGQLLAWYRSLRSIYRNIHFQVKQPGQEKQEKEINKLFAEALKFFNDAGNRQIRSDSISKIEGILDKIDILLNDLMFDYGLLMPRKRARNMEAEIEEAWFDD